MPIKLKNSQVTGRIPVANDLAIGEVALNTADGKLYTKHSDESIKLISPSKTDLDLNNVDNTSDVNKPVSTAQATAIALKADVDTTYTKVETDAAIATAIPSFALDLNNVDNTSDVNKPVSTATTAAIAVAAAQADAGLAFERWGRELSESALIASVDSTQPLKTKKTQNTSYGTYDGFLANLSEGSLQSYPIGGGGNLSDTPTSWRANKYNTVGSTSPGAGGVLGTPGALALTDWTIIGKRYYVRGGTDWSMRERMWQGESLSGSPSIVGKSECVFSSDLGGEGSPSPLVDSSSYSYVIPYTGDVTQSSALPVGISVQGKYIEQATVQSIVLAVNDVVVFHVNGKQAMVSWSTGDGISLNTVAAQDYSPAFFSYTATAAVTLYYHYWAIGDDVSRTFVKVLKQTATTPNWHFKMGPDCGGNTWYWYGTQIKAKTYGGIFYGVDSCGPLVRPSVFCDGNPWWPEAYGGFYITSRSERYYTNSITTTNQPYTIGFKFNLDDVITAGQSVVTIGNTTNGVVVTLVSAYKLQAVIYSAGVAVATIPIWQYTANKNGWFTNYTGTDMTSDDVAVAICYNPLDVAASTRMYVNGKLVFTSAGNVNICGTAVPAGYNIGSTANGTVNGFIGWFDYFYMVPEDHCARYTQGATTIYADAFSPTYLATLQNFADSAAVSASTANPPPEAYVIGTYPNGTTISFDSCSDNAEAAFALTCSLTTGLDTAILAFTGGGFAHTGGRFLITGAYIPTATHVYADVAYGDKVITFVDGLSNPVGALVTSVVSLTFLRVNRGWALKQYGNPVAVTKQNALVVTLTNNILTAFPNVTFVTMITGGTYGSTFRADYPDAYLTTNTVANDLVGRQIQNALYYGKYYNITGSGITLLSSAQTPVYVTEFIWDWAGRGVHFVRISQNTSLAYAAGTMTLQMTLSNLYLNNILGLDITGGIFPVDPGSNTIWSRFYSNKADYRRSGSVDIKPVDAEVTYGFGQVNSWRLAPPNGIYDSGMFVATSVTYAKKMYIGYGWTGWLINYGTTGTLNRVASYPQITALTTQVSSDGINIATVAGTTYRVVILPMNVQSLVV